MSPVRRQYFTLHELLIMASLAALGGVAGSLVSLVGRVVWATLGLPGGLQFLAGVHVLWLILAAGLIRKPGAATATALLKGAVELLAGSPHGLLAFALAGIAGVTVDLAWLLLGARDRLAGYVLAGGLGAASNLVVFKLVAALPDQRAVTLALLVLAAVAFVSGALLAGLLGWGLLQALRRAGVTGAHPPQAAVRAPSRLWMSLGALGAALMFVGLAMYLARWRADSDRHTDAAAPPAPPVHTMATG